jgi:hypothetical protein
MDRSLSDCDCCSWARADSGVGGADFLLGAIVVLRSTEVHQEWVMWRGVCFVDGTRLPAPRQCHLRTSVAVCYGITLCPAPPFESLELTSCPSTSTLIMTGNLDDDEYVANLLKQDAKSAKKKYELVGIDAFNPKRCVTNLLGISECNCLNEKSTHAFR